MKSFLKKINFTGQSGLTDLGYLIIRIGFGVLVLTHGYSKLVNFDKLSTAEFFNPLGLGIKTSLVLAIFAEFVCAISIALGFFTRLASIPVVIQFIVVFFVVHGNDAFGERELPATYLILAIGILLMGSGRYSIDRRLGY
ncbi:MAG: DoxX family protein [Bacteroidetes bacterium]|nr:DoxX family protein [Bacteroidota bacterium]